MLRRRGLPQRPAQPAAASRAETHLRAVAGFVADVGMHEPLVWFAPDSLLGKAVMSEPVSEAKFPASTECTGNFIRSAPAARKTAKNQSGRPVFYERIPYAFEQGIFRRVAGN